MALTTLHVRAESKLLEHRSAVTPTVAKKLVDAGYIVNVEKSPLSIFNDSEYESTGAILVPTGSWVDVPSEHIVIGLKELPEEDFPLKHTVSYLHSIEIHQSLHSTVACTVCSLSVFPDKCFAAVSRLLLKASRL